MLKISTVCQCTSFKQMALLIIGTNVGLLHYMPNFQQLLLQIVSVVNSQLTDMPLDNSTNFVVVGLRSELFGGQLSGEMNAAVACSRKLIMCTVVFQH